MTLIELTAGRASAVLDTRGGRLAQLTVDGHDLLAPHTGRWEQSGCYPMVPWAGRLDRGRLSFRGVDHQLPITMDPHAIHGVATKAEWSDDGDGRLRIGLGEGWPLGGEARTAYQLTEDSIACEVSVTATDQPMPAVVGFHPCFARSVGGHADALSFEPAFMWERGDDYLPTGNRIKPAPDGPWDDAFGGVRSAPRISWGDELSVELRSAADTWVVFDQQPTAICVEPQTDAPNALAMGGGTTLEPGETVALSLEIAWSG